MTLFPKCNLFVKLDSRFRENMVNYLDKTIKNIKYYNADRKKLAKTMESLLDESY